MSYRIGDILASKYRVSRNFDSAGAGTCQWGFAIYNGNEYFVKKFLTPVYPGLLVSLSEKTKQKRKEQCSKFEAKHEAIKEALSVCGEGGLVVKTIDFFKFGNEYGEHYFKICQKVDTSSLSNQIFKLEAKERLLVMITAAFAINILHIRGIIHLDLKPENILIQKHNDRHIAKIIDFDSSVLEGESIVPEFIVGDQVYYSPEIANYIATNGETAAPTNKSDIFSLGLIFCKYWTGKVPIFSTTYTYTYAYEAVNNGETLSIPEVENEINKSVKNSRIMGTGTVLINRKSSPALPKDPIASGIDQLISAMLAQDPGKRPSASEVHQKLKDIQRICNEEKDVTGSLILKMPTTSTNTYWYECKHCLYQGEFLSKDISHCQVCGSYDIRVKREQIWDWFSDIKTNKQIILVQSKGVNSGGVLADIQGLQGFIPRSHLVEKDDMARLVGQTLSVIILEVDSTNQDVVLSHREASTIIHRVTSISKFQQGQLVEGKIVKILAGSNKPFGVLVDIGGISALLHIKEVSERFVTDLPSLFKVNELVKAVIINIDEKRWQVDISTKCLENHPGEILTQMAKVMAEAEKRHLEKKLTTS